MVSLADGSIVTLGPLSTLRYSTDGTGRDLQLTGLGRFRVVHDATRPFVVRAGNATTTDLGTDFVVRAYREDSTVEVAVSTGRVRIAGGRSTFVDLGAGAIGTVAIDGAVQRDQQR